MKKEDIQIKLDLIPENVEKLEILRGKSLDEFEADFRNVDSALHRLQTSIQALIDIGGYIVASLGLRTPSTNAEVIEILVEKGLIDAKDKDKYIKMIHFRNRVVHLYNDIDIKVLYQIVQEEIGDIKELYLNLLQIIEEHAED